MNNILFGAAFAIVLCANTLALIHVARNRAGTPDAEIWLSSRELVYPNRVVTDDDTGVSLNLQWTALTNNPPFYNFGQAKWLDGPKLQALGFDCSVDPTRDEAARFYGRQEPRRAFVALQYNGRAWQAISESLDSYAARHIERQPERFYNKAIMSHLVAVDADRDARVLRARYPGRSAVLIVPVTIAIALNPFPHPGRASDVNKPVRIEGQIHQIANDIHLPRPFSDAFERRPSQVRSAVTALYTVRLCYGRLHEPWISGVDLKPPTEDSTDPHPSSVP